MHVRLRVLLLALIAAAVVVTGATASTSTSAGAAANYIVLYKGAAVPTNAASTIAAAGGSLVYSYDQIGVAIARSDNASFRDNLLKDSRIENARLRRLASRRSCRTSRPRLVGLMLRCRATHR
jgi:hypothetical protein